MTRTQQNKVPEEFNNLYDPILNLKKILESKTTEPDPEQVTVGFVMLHFTTFMIIHLSKETGQSSTKALICRDLIEHIMQEDTFSLNNAHFAKLFSYIDNVGKILNTTTKAYIYIAMYNAYLDSKIYQHFHHELGIFDFKDFQYVKPETVQRMKSYHDASIKLLEEYDISHQPSMTLIKRTTAQPKLNI